MSDVDELVTWLRAQLDDDKRVACETTLFDWRRVPEDEADADGEGRVETADGQIVIWDHGCHLSRHIGRWSPARVLAEVDAKRRILDQHDAMQAAVQASEGTILAGAARVRLGAYAFVVKCLALPYADRPGYRNEWKP